MGCRHCLPLPCSLHSLPCTFTASIWWHQRTQNLLPCPLLLALASVTFQLCSAEPRVGCLGPANEHLDGEIDCQALWYHALWCGAEEAPGHPRRVSWRRGLLSCGLGEEGRKKWRGRRVSGHKEGGGSEEKREDVVPGLGAKGLACEFAFLFVCGDENCGWINAHRTGCECPA